MKSKIELVQKQIFKNEKMEFDDEGFLICQSLLSPMKKREHFFKYATDSEYLDT